MKPLYFQVCLLQGVIFICVNICIFHSRFCFPCSMTVMLEQPILSLSISFPRCFQNNFQCSFCAGPITSVSLSSCNHKFSSKWSIITYAARRVQVLWRFLSLFFKGSHRFGVLPVFSTRAYLQHDSTEAGTLPDFTSFSPSINCLQAAVPVICRLQLTLKGSQNNACYWKADGQRWPGVFSPTLVKMCRAFFFV